MIDGVDRGEVVPGSGDQGVGGRDASGGTSGGNAGDGIQHDHLRVLGTLRAELAHLEEMLCAGHHPVTGASIQVARAVATGTQTARVRCITCMFRRGCG
jgi:hypothetical protein